MEFPRTANLLLALAVSTSLAGAVKAAIPNVENSVLTELYLATDGDHWAMHNNWAPGTHGGECGWWGVECDAQQTHVVGIYLSSNNLVGALPADLNLLVKLTNFDVSNNHLTGPIPNLAPLTNLEVFYVDSNHLTGPIPALTTLTKLTTFLALHNQLSGPIPSLAGLTNLKTFGVGNNQLTQGIPALTGLTNLETFDVYSNQLTGSIPSLSGLTHLKEIELGANALTGHVPRPPNPNSFIQGYSNLCPNHLDLTNTSSDAFWNFATVTPWQSACQ